MTRPTTPKAFKELITRLAPDAHIEETWTWYMGKRHKQVSVHLSEKTDKIKVRVDYLGGDVHAHVIPKQGDIIATIKQFYREDLRKLGEDTVLALKITDVFYE